MPRIKLLSFGLVACLASIHGFANDANRLTYLDQDDPFYVGVNFPKLTTPQWIGEPDVKAVVTFGVDDMRGNPQKYETFLRPILERLKQIDGRAPVSIFCNALTPEEPMAQTWLAEGLSIEVHTLSHPCPILAKGNFQSAVDTFHGGVDLLSQIKGNRPVAFRTPCCDSINSPSPRLYAEIFNRTTAAGQFLQADSSVMNILSTNDPALPREMVLDANGKEKFRKYVPFPSFVTTIENYPYPYVIGKLCWEFPAMVPSDWEAQHLHGTNNPVTVADWKAALDATVLKEGIFNFIFHPHGWIASTQMVEFIDYAVAKYGKGVKFLNYREAVERLNKNLLGGQPLRASSGQDNGVRLVDVNNDGYLDVIIGNERVRKTRAWQPAEKRWSETDFPVALVRSFSHPGAKTTPDEPASRERADRSNEGTARSVPLSSSNGERAGVRSRTESAASHTPHPGPLPIEGRGSGAGGAAETSLTSESSKRIDVKDVATPSVPLSSSNEERAGVRSRAESAASHTPHPSPLPVEGRGSGLAGATVETGARFGVVTTNGFASVLLRNEQISGAWHFDGAKWVEAKSLLAGLNLKSEPVLTTRAGRDLGVRLRDVDNDGRCEVLVSNDKQNAVFTWSNDDKSWRPASFALPEGTSIVDANGRDNGLRFVDLNSDGLNDVLFSNPVAWSTHIFISTAKPNLGWERGWSFKVNGGKRGEPGEIPMIVRNSTNRNNGAWFHSKHLWVQNEDTARLPDLVDRRSFASLLTGAEAPAKSPQEALKSFQLRPGFKIELVASEPLVVDPVAFEWGPDGKLWVAEMRDYPSGVDGKGKPGGVIKLLEDRDRNGRYDHATIFMDGVNFPNGVMPWRKGLLVSAAPEIFYAEDTDGDGKADLKRTLLTGFVKGNQQHRVNGFDYGLDGWVYVANGDSGGSITNALEIESDTRLAAPQVPSGRRVLPSVKDLRGHDLRFNPDTGDFELVAGQTQFGRHRDDWGNWFGNNNPNWLWHYFVPIEFQTAHSPPEWKSARRNLANYRERNRVYAISQPQRRFNWPDAIREVTSANSAAPYRDELFGPDFATSVFISEPANNVVHRELLEPDGAGFKSRRAADEEDHEFLASTDNWFRPTTLKTGPDGALYIADMYRLVIEHPEYFPEELKNRPDLRAGDDKGRIWRVYPEDAKLRPPPRLDELDLTGLIAALDSSNGWQRDTAQRLLTEGAAASLNAGVLRRRLRPESVEALALIAAKNARPQVRLQALATLGTLGKLRSSHVLAAFQDRDPRVRAFSLSVIEPDRHFRDVPSLPRGGMESVELLQAVTKLTNDPSPLVRFRFALALGRRAAAATNALVALALREDDPDIQAAILNAVGTRDSLKGPGARPVGLLLQLLDSSERSAWITRLLSHLARIVAGGDEWDRAAGPIMTALAARGAKGFSAWQMEVAAGWIDGIETKFSSLAKQPLFHIGRRDPETPARLKPLSEHARQVAANASAPESERSLAIRLLARGVDRHESDIQLLATLLKPAVPTACQNAALDAMKRLRDRTVSDALLGVWPELSPSLRANALGALLSRDEWANRLLNALETGEIAAGEISPAHQQILLKQRSEAVRERATRVFAARPTDRQQLVRNYESIKELSPNAGRGALLYQQNCAICHQLRGEGNEVGPDLGTVADKPMGTLLVGILDPNQAFEAKYVSYTATTRNGREITGMIASETPASITVRSPGGTEEIIARSEIQSLSSSKLSLMPEGLESVLSPQDMADLISFIRSR